MPSAGAGRARQRVRDHVHERPGGAQPARPARPARLVARWAPHVLRAHRHGRAGAERGLRPHRRLRPRRPSVGRVLVGRDLLRARGSARRAPRAAHATALARASRRCTTARGCRRGPTRTRRRRCSRSSASRAPRCSSAASMHAINGGDPLSAWDLDELRASYEEFVEEFGPLLDRVDEGDVGAAEAMVARTRVMDVWRQFPNLDPELPEDVLPAGLAAARGAGDLRSGLRRARPARRDAVPADPGRVRARTREAGAPPHDQGCIATTRRR